MKTYFIYSKSQTAIKIGKSMQPEKRLSDLKTACPDAVLCGFLEGDHESNFHERFKHLKIAREWFRGVDELSQFIRLTFNFVLPYHRKEIKKPVTDSLALVADDLSHRIGSAITTTGTSEDFFFNCDELVQRNYPECERVDEPYQDECDCPVCDSLDKFHEALWQIEDMWNQVFGYSFRKDGPYYRLVVVFWMPKGRQLQSTLMRFCGDLEYIINEMTEVFSVDFFFVRRSGEVLTSDEFYFDESTKTENFNQNV